MNYFWKLGAAREVMRKWRENPASDASPSLEPPPALGDAHPVPVDAGIRAAEGVRGGPEALAVARYIGSEVRPALRITRGEGIYVPRSRTTRPINSHSRSSTFWTARQS